VSSFQSRIALKNNLKQLLDEEMLSRNKIGELSEEKPDPLIIVQKWQDEKVALISALFAYGKASLILKFLQQIPFEILHSSDEVIERELQTFYYRFQKGNDLIALFKALKRVGNLEEIFFSGYKKEESVIDGFELLISELKKANPYESKGYDFLIGKIPNKKKLSGFSPMKRWNLFLRWLVRKDNLDLGIWKKIDKKDLIIPLDTHTFQVSHKIGLLTRKTYDLKSAVLLTEELKKFDKTDPVKYDFALYRIGQENISITDL
jgi:uncharacterized protein (TIGR02757 family)